MYFNSVTVGHVAMDFFQYTTLSENKGIGLEIKKIPGKHKISWHLGYWFCDCREGLWQGAFSEAKRRQRKLISLRRVKSAIYLMKYYTGVNEVEALQWAHTACMHVCMHSLCECALLYEWGFVCQGVAVIMLASSRREVFQGRLSNVRV